MILFHNENCTDHQYPVSFAAGNSIDVTLYECDANPFLAIFGAFLITAFLKQLA